MGIGNNPAWLTVFIMTVFLVVLEGCASREHMSSDYGDKTRAFMAKQRVYEDASKEPVQGLDSEEASIIQGTYRKNMGAKSEEPEDSGARVLIVEESKKDGKK